MQANHGQNLYPIGRTPSNRGPKNFRCQVPVGSGAAHAPPWVILPPDDDAIRPPVTQASARFGVGSLLPGGPGGRRLGRERFDRRQILQPR